jgi:hypothetical protein
MRYAALGDERIEPSATMLRSDCSFQGIVCVLPSEETLFQTLTPVLPIVGSTVAAQYLRTAVIV